MPELVPARMVNEVLYCPRLMYLEWAQGEWAPNRFTAEGKSAHRRADRGGGSLEPGGAEDDDDTPRVARSLWLSSDRLGITAKVDVVEARGKLATPVEIKRGRRAPVPEQVYPPERAQLCAQALLLREHGYRCDRGLVYFAQERLRVEVPISPRLIQLTLRAVRRARELARRAVLPPPLVGSRKCVGCSLSGICLPDEVALLQELGDPATAGSTGTDQSTRRLQPARDDRVPVYVHSQGGRVGLSGERLSIQAGDEKGEARLPNTSQLCLFGNVQVTTQALRELMSRDIPVSFFTTGGWFVGRARGLGSNNVELRMAQYRRADNEAASLAIARRLIWSKLRNSRTMLRRNAAEPDKEVLRGLRQLAGKALEAQRADELLGIEGSGGRLYFSQLSSMLKPQSDGEWRFEFTGRNRRPPRDPVNALLSLAYSLLTKELTLATSAVGLDPQLGFYHRPRFGRPALALDLMEEFRPIVADSVVISAINNGVVKPDDFQVTPMGTSLRSAGRRRFIQAFERRMDQLVTHPVFNYRISYRRVFEVQARLLSRHLLGELEVYPSFQTR